MDLKIAVNSIFSKDIDEERVMHSKTDNMEIICHYKGDEVIEKILNHFFLDIKFGWKHQ